MKSNTITVINLVWIIFYTSIFLLLQAGILVACNSDYSKDLYESNKLHDTISAVDSPSHFEETVLTVKSISPVHTTIQLVIDNGFGPAIALVDSAYMLIGIDYDTAYCDIKYTELPTKQDVIWIRKMSGSISTDTTTHYIWMQVSSIRSEQQNSSHFGGF